jgi:GT2 family glycosyltransferase
MSKFKRLSAIELPVSEDLERGITVGLIVDGWAQDVSECVNRYLKHTSANILLFDIATDEASTVAQDLADKYPNRVDVLHVDKLGWSKAVAAILRAAKTELVAIADISTLLDGDALQPLVDLINLDKNVAAVGWRGVNIDLDSDWFESIPAKGEVDQLLGYLILIKKQIGVNIPPHKDARFYRNADLEWSLSLREAGYRLFTPVEELPISQGRHHGYFDTDVEFRDSESKKNYNRLLRRFKGKTEILAPRK